MIFDRNFENVYAGSIGFVTGTISYLQEEGLDGPFYIVIIKTIIVATISTLTGLFVRRLYNIILKKIHNK